LKPVQLRQLLLYYTNTMISLGLKLALSAFPRSSTPSINGLAYPNETLVAPAGTSYQWYVNNTARATTQTMTPTVLDIGLVVRCVVDGVECVPVTMWHPDEITAVKHFFWAASGAYNFLGNYFTDANRSITLSGFPILSSFETTNPNQTLPTTSTQNGKPFYKFGSQGDDPQRYEIEVFWDNVNQRWELRYQAAVDDSGENFAVMQKYGVGITDYPWQATWADGSVSPVATTEDTLAEDEEPVAAWRDIISGFDATASGDNIAYFKAGDLETGDLDTESIKFDSTDFFNIPSGTLNEPRIREVFNSQNNCYIFAGVRNTNPTGGDALHGVVSINRNSTVPKLGLLMVRATNPQFRTSASSGNGSASSATFTPPSTAVSTAYNVLTSEALFTSGRLNLRVNGSQTATTSISTTIPNTTTSGSYIGATANSSSNFDGYMTAIILASDSSPISATDRARIERFIGLLDRLNVAYGVIGTPSIGSDNPANAAEPDATAWVLMEGPFYNTPGDPSSDFVGGASWRKMEPGALVNNKTSYTYGDETVSWTGSVWQYSNTSSGVIASSTANVTYPWLAIWTNGFTATKITPSYSKTTNYPAVP